ncbi:MAG: YihY/virulence factor BrkB family protein [Elusimicrobia bacterium]|nr:YihY/virulence factor BrkB family protein [Elusimicrobiota bacterium]
MRLAASAGLLKDTVASWSGDGAPRMGAALAFYTFFSLAPLVIILTAIVGAVFGEEAARGEVFRQMRELIGSDAAAAVQRVVARADRPAAGGLAAAAGVLTLLLGASAMVSELQEALNNIWKAERPAGFRALIRKRLLSMAMILVVGFLLLVSLVLDAVVTAAGAYFGGLAGVPGLAVRWADALASLTVVFLLFAALFKWLPDAEIAWREVWQGAALTAVLFAAGKSLLALYLGRQAVSPYGAAGSLVLVLLWVYYSAQILYLGAEFTKECARRGRGALGPLPGPRHAGPERVHPVWLRERRHVERRRIERRAVAR